MSYLRPIRLLALSGFLACSASIHGSAGGPLGGDRAAGDVVGGPGGDGPITCDLFANCVLPAVVDLAACIPQDGSGSFDEARAVCTFDDSTTVTLDPPLSSVWGLLPSDIRVNPADGDECFLDYTGPAVHPPTSVDGFTTYSVTIDNTLVVETTEEADGALQVYCDGKTYRGDELPDTTDCPEAALFAFPTGGGQILNSTIRFLLRAEAGVFFACDL